MVYDTLSGRGGDKNKHLNSLRFLKHCFNAFGGKSLVRQQD